MPPEGPLTLIRIGEDSAQADAVRVLTDRVLIQSHDWVRDMADDDQADGVRTWSTLDGSPGWDKLTRVTDAFSKTPRHRLAGFGRIHGRFQRDGQARKALPDANMFRKVLTSAAVALHGRGTKDLHDFFVIVMRDTDGSRDVAAAWELAIHEERPSRLPFTPLLACFHQEAEAWYLAGFERRQERPAAARTGAGQTAGLSAGGPRTAEKPQPAQRPRPLPVRGGQAHGIPTLTGPSRYVTSHRPPADPLPSRCPHDR